MDDNAFIFVKLNIPIISISTEGFINGAGEDPNKR
jgi:hypothetical protein